MKPHFSTGQWALVVASLLAAACTGEDAFPSSFTTKDSKLNVHLTTAPDQPPSVGVDGVELLLTDPETGKPVDGEEITLTPFMPAMGHGTDTIPQCQAMGQGRYVCTDVNLFMPGEWQLRFQFSGAVTDSAAPNLDNVQ